MTSNIYDIFCFDQTADFFFGSNWSSTCSRRNAFIKKWCETFKRSAIKWKKFLGHSVTIFVYFRCVVIHPKGACFPKNESSVCQTKFCKILQQWVRYAKNWHLKWLSIDKLRAKLTSNVWRFPIQNMLSGTVFSLQIRKGNFFRKKHYLFLFSEYNILKYTQKHTIKRDFIWLKYFRIIN